MDSIVSSIVPFVSEHWLALLAGLVNFVWVYLEYKGSIWLWPVGIVLPILYIAVSWQALFLGNILVNVYYLITSCIGWYMWLRQSKGEGQGSAEGIEEGGITHVAPRSALLHLGILLALAYPMYLLLVGRSMFPRLDVSATLISFLGMVYLSQKRLEHWLCWIIANSLSAYIFLKSGDSISAFVFSVNLIVSVLGYRRWYLLMQKQDKQ